MKKENIIQITIIIALILILCVLIALYFDSGTNSQGNMKENGLSSQMGTPEQGGPGSPGGQNGGDSSNVENSEFYGVNVGILVTSGSGGYIEADNINMQMAQPFKNKK